MAGTIGAVSAEQAAAAITLVKNGTAVTDANMVLTASAIEAGATVGTLTVNVTNYPTSMTVGEDFTILVDWSKVIGYTLQNGIGTITPNQKYNVKTDIGLALVNRVPANTQGLTGVSVNTDLIVEFNQELFTTTTQP